MITIKDIAKLAGVSHGTVSNVLNKRDNVSAEKIVLVEKAAKELGYKPNEQASQLRASQSKKIIIIMPNISSKEYQSFYKGVQTKVLYNDYELVLWISGNNSENEKNLLQKASATAPFAIIVIPTKKYKKSNLFLGDNIYFFEQKIKDIPSISFDYFEIGKNIANKCLANNPKNILICCNHESKSSDEEFLKGTNAVLKHSNVTTISYNIGYEFHVAFEMLNSNEDYDAIITTCEKVAKHFLELKEFSNSKDDVKIYTLCDKQILKNSDLYQYELNYQLAGRKVAEMVVNNVKIDSDIVMSSEKFNTIDIGFEELKKESINLLTLSSPTASIIKKIVSDFSKKTGIDVKIIELPYEELFKSLKDEKTLKLYDLVRLDVAWLNGFAKDLLLEFDEEIMSKLDLNIPKSVPNDYYMVENKRYSLPFDASIQILYYRKDLFENSLIKREFYEKYKRQLEPPKNYDEYLMIAEFFTKKFNENSKTDYGIKQVYGLPMPAASDFLPILLEKKELAANGDTFQINEKVFKKSLATYIEMQKYTDNKPAMWWEESLKDFVNGKTAMCAVYSNHVSTSARSLNNQVIGSIGFCNMPSKHSLLGGGVIGICKHTRRKEQVTMFLKWLYSDEIANLCTYLGGFIANESIYDNVKILDLYPWISKMDEYFETGFRRRNELKYENFDEFEFENELGKLVRLASQKIISVDKAYELIDEYINNLTKA